MYLSYYSYSVYSSLIYIYLTHTRPWLSSRHIHYHSTVTSIYTIHYTLYMGVVTVVCGTRLDTSNAGSSVLAGVTRGQVGLSGHQGYVYLIPPGGHLPVIAGN